MRSPYRRCWTWVMLTPACWGLSACSVISPMPLWELTKGAGSAVNAAIGLGPGAAVNTIYHEHPGARQVCIEFNPDCQVPDLIPALQAELMARQVGSRVYESSANVNVCPYWVRYSAFTTWDAASSGGGNAYTPYINRITLTMFSADGKVVSSGAYVAERSLFGAGKWASVQSKLSPVVEALVARPDKVSAQAWALKDFLP